MKILVGCFFFLLVSCGSQENTVKIKGSDTEVNVAVMLAEAFRDYRSDVTLSVSGGGSGLGIASLLNGNADIANSSRCINNSETALFAKRGISLDSFVFAIDAVAFVVSGSLPIDTISISELRKLLSGEYKNWLPLTGRELPVNIYGRQSNSGTYTFVKQRLDCEFTPYAKQMNGNAQILEAIKADKSGIGYVGAGYIKHGHRDLKVLVVRGEDGEAVSPLDAQAVAGGRYSFQRPLYQYFRSASYESVKPFIDFENTPAGQAIIARAGYYAAMP